MEIRITSFLFVASGIPILFILIILASSSDIIIFANTLITFSNSLLHCYVCKSRRGEMLTQGSVWISKGIDFFVFSIRFYPLLCILFFLSRPYAMYFFPSLLPLEYRHGLLPLLFLYHQYTLVAGTCGAIGSLTLLAILYGNNYFRLIRQITLNGERYWSRGVIRSPRHVTLILRSLDILTGLFEKYVRDGAMPLQLIFTRAIMICNYILVRHGTRMGPFQIIVFTSIPFAATFVWMGVFHFAAQIYRSWTRCIKSWTFTGQKVKRIGGQGQPNLLQPEDRKMWNKIKRSFRPICIRVGNYYVVKHKTLLDVNTSIIVGTVRLLLLF